MPATRIGISLATAISLGACSGRPPSYLGFQIPPYPYAGEAVRFGYGYHKGNQGNVELKLVNQRTQGALVRKFTVYRDAPYSMTLDAANLPDLDGNPPGVEWFSISATTLVPGNYWDGLWWAAPAGESLSTEFAVVTDRTARQPAFAPIPVFEPIGLPGAPADPWAQVEDTAPMEDAALQAATERGGRNLTVTNRLVTQDERSKARTPGLGKLAAEVYRFDVRGTFPRQVLLSAFPASRGGETIATPLGFTMLVPRVARPPAVEIEPILPNDN